MREVIRNTSTSSLYKMYIREGWHPILRKPLYEAADGGTGTFHAYQGPMVLTHWRLSCLPPPHNQPWVPGIPGTSHHRLQTDIDILIKPCHNFNISIEYPLLLWFYPGGADHF